jgi:muramidase (phage lysozyme)
MADHSISVILVDVINTVNNSEQTLFFLFSGLILGVVGFVAYKQRAQTYAYYGDSGYDVTQNTPTSYTDYTSESNIYQDAVENTPQSVAVSSDNFITKFFGNMKMGDVDPSLLYNQNIAAFLKMTRVGEGTADAGGYNRLFGGGTFNSYAWHPNILVVKNGYRSTAAGAYQFKYSTWQDTAKAMGLIDFSPPSQDLGALGRLAYRGAINDILAGNIYKAIEKTRNEWVSLPGATAKQPTISLTRALNAYVSAGGIITA